MKLISLNLWGGYQGQVLLDFLKEHSANTDIFCFQEVFNTAKQAGQEDFLGRIDLYSELCGILPDFTGYFKMTSQNHDLKQVVNFPVNIGQAIFVKNTLKVSRTEAIEIYMGKGPLVDPLLENLPTFLQRVEIDSGSKKLQIYNFHGITYPGEKIDSPDRLKQSEKILSAMAAQEGSKILCGDFNLNPDTESIKMFGAAMKDLIKEYKITNTRNEVSWKYFNNKQYFADFTFVSPDIKVVNFEVPYNLVSDHLPMILEFEIQNLFIKKPTPPVLAVWFG
jgi:exonuclease III